MKQNFQQKDLEVKAQTPAQTQGNDINFFKLKNSKLFQKFLKEEGQVPKMPTKNLASSKPDENLDFQRPNKSSFEQPARRFRDEDQKTEEIKKRVTPLKHYERSQERDDRYVSRKSNNEDDKELQGYSQIVPGLILLLILLISFMWFLKATCIKLI